MTCLQDLWKTSLKGWKGISDILYCPDHNGILLYNLIPVWHMQDYEVVWARLGLRRPLAQTHAHSRVSYKARPGGSGLYLQYGLENFQGWRLHSLLHCALFLWGKHFFCLVWTYLASAYAHCLSASGHALLWTAWLHLLGEHPGGAEGLLLGAPTAIPSAGEPALVPWPVLTGHALCVDLWTCSSLSVSFLHRVAPNWMLCSRCGIKAVEYRE